MSRITTTNYQADTDTLFAWATDTDDYFSRTLDLSYLARALERHTHTTGRGLPVQGYAAGSIPTSAIVPSPIFPGTVTIAAGGLSVTGTVTVTGDENISGALTVAGNITSTAGSINSSVGGLTVHGNISTNTGGLTVTGTSSITGNTSIVGTLASGAHTITGGGISVSGGNIVTTSGFVGATTGLSTTSGGATIVGNSSVTGTLLVSGAITAQSTITVTGQFTALGGASVTADFGVGGNLGVTGICQPAHDSDGTTWSDLGVSTLRWRTLYAWHFSIYGAASIAGLLTLTGGLTVSSGFTNLVDLTLTGALSVAFATSGFAMIQPVATNTYTLGNSTLKWSAVWAVNGTIQTSSREVKAHIDTLDTDEALKVALDTKLYEFEYLEEGKKPHARKALRRHRQVGFMADEAHPMLMVADDGVNAQTTASVALGAIQALAAKVEALTARLAELEGPRH